jgi:hypothetical protein
MNGIGLIDGGIIVEGGVASCECCDPPPECDFPLLDVTMTWTDADITKSFMGESFTNGETKAMCPTSYSCTNNTGATSTISEKWQGVGTSNNTPTFYVSSKIYTASSTYNGSGIATTFSGIVLGNRYFHTTTGISRKAEVQTIAARRGGSPGRMTSWHATEQFSNSASAFSVKHYVYYYNLSQSNTPTMSTFKNGINANFEGTMTSAAGLTIAWARNNSGVAWGDCL